MNMQRKTLALGIVLFALALAGLNLAFAGASRAEGVSPVEGTLPAPDSPDAPPVPYFFTSTVYSSYPDNGCPTWISNTIFVSQSLFVHDVNVGLNFTLPYRSDLRARLTAPNGKRVGLIFTSPDNSSNLDVLIDDESPFLPGQPPGNVYHNPSAPYWDYQWRTGYDDLRLLNGINANGPWRLEFCDTTPNVATNQFNFWSLHLMLGDPAANLSGAEIIGPHVVQFNTPFTQTLLLPNNTMHNGGLVTMTHPLPAEAVYLGNLTCSYGTCFFDAPAKTIRWSGMINPYANIYIQYRMRFDAPGDFVMSVSLDGPGLTNPVAFSDTIRSAPVLFWYWDFEGSDGGFDTNTPPGEWEWGAPFSGPPSAHGRFSLWGTDLDGDYEIGTTSTLSITLDLPTIAVTQSLQIEWWQWIERETGATDYSFFVDGVELWKAPASLFGWLPVNLNLSSFAGQQVMLKWVAYAAPGGLTTEPGWYIDDMTIMAAGLAPYPMWDKQLWINGAGPYLPGQGPFDVTSGDIIQVVDQVGPHITGPYTFTVTDSWTSGLELLSYQASAGSVTSGTATELIWTVPNAVANGEFAITKTYQMLTGPLFQDISETLSVEGITGSSMLPLHFNLQNSFADLSLTQIDFPDPALISETVVYSLHVTNQGPDDATGVKVLNYLGAGMVFAGSNPPNWCFQDEPQRVACGYPVLAAGQSAEAALLINFDASNPDLGNVASNYAIVSSQQVDLDPTNNAATAFTSVLREVETGPQALFVNPPSALNTSATPIEVHGLNFASGAQVYLGATELASPTVTSATLILAEIPALLTPGTYPLRVVNPDGQSGILLGAFTVLADAPPTISQVTPQSGLNDTPVALTIDGSNFAPGVTELRLISANISVTLENVQFINSTRLRAVAPMNIPAGEYDLWLWDELQSLPAAYTALDPAETDDLYANGAFDLAIQPPAPQAGETVSLTITLRRLGGAEIISDTVVDFYLDDPTASSALLGRAWADPLKPRDAAQAVITFTLPITSGSFTIFAQIDPENLVPESNEFNNTITRTLRVLPESVSLPPEILGFALNNGAANTLDLQIPVSITAANDPAYALLIEYAYDRSSDSFLPVANSGWLPWGELGAEFEWALQPLAGAHYLQAWVAGSSGLISPAPALQRINYLPPVESIVSHDVRMYRYDLLPGDKLIVRLTSFSGDADLYVWGPDRLSVGDSYLTTAVDEVVFTATLTGTYQIEVEGFTNAEFGLEIVHIARSPAGEAAPAAGRLPFQKGRKQPYSDTVPPGAVGLPETPLIVFEVYLPLIRK